MVPSQTGSFGTTESYGGRGDHPLLLHWNGTRWTVISTPPQQHAPLRWARLSDVSTGQNGLAWAVGRAGSGAKEQPIVTAWADRWRSMTVPRPVGLSLNDIAVDGGNGFTVAVGSAESGRHLETTLIEDCGGT